MKTIAIVTDNNLLFRMHKLRLERDGFKVMQYECGKIHPADSGKIPEADSLIVDTGMTSILDINDCITKLHQIQTRDKIQIVLLIDAMSETLHKEIRNKFPCFLRDFSEFNELLKVLKKSQKTKLRNEQKAELTKTEIVTPTSTTGQANTEKAISTIESDSHILLADDSRAIRKFVSKILKDKGFRVSVFENGQQLLDYLKTEAKGDIIILDNQMPVKDGISTLQEIKNNTRLKEIPVLFLSAITDKDQVVKALELGADDYMGKPFHNNEFFARLNVHLKIDSMKKELIEKNAKITEQKDQISEKLEEIQRQAEKLIEYNQLIKKKNEHITASINYAKRIQEAVLPPQEIFSDKFREHFVLYMPRDIVSGDFYWAKAFDNKIFIAVADCTGHGVPGAFMSMLGMTLLNEIINNSDIKTITANFILEELRKNIIIALRQTGKEREAKDGMDISLCIIDKAQNRLQYSGAYNPVYLARGDVNNPYKHLHKDSFRIKIETGNSAALYQIKGDKMPIGIYFKKPKQFTIREIDLMHNDVIYLFTDGFVDQFGANDEKFMSHRFKKLLLQIYNKPLSEQYKIINDTHHKWKNENEQIDDILVLALKY